MKLIETLRPPHNERGVALLIALAVLVLMSILAVSFYTRQNLESSAAENARNARSAEAIAHGGLEWALILLQKDEEPGYDSNYDIWGPDAKDSPANYDRDLLFSNNTHPDEEDLSKLVDGNDARWIVVRDQFRVIGRFAAIVECENGKANVNVAGNRWNGQGDGVSPAEIKLAAIFNDIANRSLDDPQGEDEAEDIIDLRDGDGAPGLRSGDDDGDGPHGFPFCDDDADGNIDEPDEATDEPDERNMHDPTGSDIVLIDPSTVKLAITGMTATEFSTLRPYITVDSQTQNIYKADPASSPLDDWHLQVAVNTASMEEIYGALDALRNAGRLPDDDQVLMQTAVNIADFIDMDSEPQEYDVVGRTKCYGIERTAYVNEVEASPSIYRKTISGEVVDVQGHGEFIELINPYEYNGTGSANGATVTLKDVPQLAGSGVTRDMTVTVPWARGDTPGYYVIGDTSATYVFEDGSTEKDLRMPPLPGGAHKYEDLDLDGMRTITLTTVIGNTIEEAEFGSGGTNTPETRQKNDPRVNQWYTTRQTPRAQNTPWKPSVGNQESDGVHLVDHFVVYDGKIGSVGHLGRVHTGEQWRTVDLTWDRGWREDWQPHEHETWLNILDVFTISETPDNPTYGLININTAPEEVLIGLKGVDPSTAVSIANHVDATERFETIGELGFFLSKRPSGSSPGKGGSSTPSWEIEKPLADVAGLVTVRSDVLRVTVLAQAIDRQGHKTAERKLEATVLRTIEPGSSGNPATVKSRVLSMRWIAED